MQIQVERNGRIETLTLCNVCRRSDTSRHPVLRTVLSIHRCMPTDSEPDDRMTGEYCDKCYDRLKRFIERGLYAAGEVPVASLPVLARRLEQVEMLKALAVGTREETGIEAGGG